jgi:ribose-phosphate pyrophosphokinase
MNIIGEVEGRTCVIMDDMVDTAGTLCKAAQVLKERGAKQVFAYATHPVLSGGAGERIAASALDELVVTDTIPLGDEARSCAKIRSLTSAGLLAETFSRIRRGDSVMSLFAES